MKHISNERRRAIRPEFQGKMRGVRRKHWGQAERGVDAVESANDIQEDLEFAPRPVVETLNRSRPPWRPGTGTYGNVRVGEEIAGEAPEGAAVLRALARTVKKPGERRAAERQARRVV